MKKHGTILIITKTGIIALVLCMGFWLSGCIVQSIDPADHETPGVDLNRTERDFLMGMVPSPKTQPGSSFDDLVDAYEELGTIADVAMIWGNPGGIGLYDRLLGNQIVTAVRVYGLKPVLTLNFHTIKEVPGRGLQLVIDAPEDVSPEINNPEFRDLWVAEARKIAKEFQPEYFSLGNEINDYFLVHQEDLNDYLSLFDQAYQEINEVSPETKVFVVFSFTHLIDNKQWELLELFSTRADLIGLTSYPWKHFESPADIDENYYARLNQYLNVPIAFTEIGWPSTTSEGEQAEFMARFFELTNNNEVEMVNWLFLHEMDVTEGIGKSVFSPETGTIALKRADGTKKLVYHIWEEIFQGDLK